MKRFISLVLVVFMIILCVSSISSCSIKTDENKLKVVVTIFPIYDWVKNVLGDSDVDMTLLLKNSADLHNYQATVEDMYQISNCDVFIYIGGESDAWVDKALQNPKNKNRIAINLMELLGEKLKLEEVVEGMQVEEEEEGEEEEEEYDEHIWLSLKNASYLVKEIAKEIGKVDVNNANKYLENANSYAESLDALDANFSSKIANKKVDTLIFADRFPFRYLFDDYDLNYYAAFVGCSAETEASFETVIFLSKKVDELSLKHIVTIDGSDGKIAQTVKNNTKTKDQTIIVLDSLQSSSLIDVQNGKSYLKTMENNLKILEDVLL